MEENILCQLYAKELQAEYGSTKKCLERIPESLWQFKPHPTSMNLQHLVLLVADIPQWITEILEKGVVDFETYQHKEPKTTEELVAHFEHCFAGAIKSFEKMNDKELTEPFELRNGEKVLFKTSKGEMTSSTINHWVHHRGQLTVYMRMNEIAVPSVYGPSADDKNY
jgi:uncharacterized damage-inducible protein DinB